MEERGDVDGSCKKRVVGCDKDDSATGPASSSSSSRAQQLWRQVKSTYSLVDYHALPSYLRDNEFILKHYRADWPLKQTLFSIFTIHNETLNIWTHLVGFIIFLSITIYTVLHLPKVAELSSFMPNVPNFHKIQSELISSLPSLPHWHLPESISNCLPGGATTMNSSDRCLLRSMREDAVNLMAPFLRRPATRWPFLIFLGGAMFCLLSSSTCHLLYCHSKQMAYIMLRLDYAGIASLIAASFYPPVYYSFMCSPFLRDSYLLSITTIGVATVLVSLFPVFETPKFRIVRAALFSGMGISGIAPILHKSILHSSEPAVLETTGYEIAMGVFYGLGVLVYATRVPERWNPGKFDIAGHSHQLFHVLVVAGAYTHYQAGLVYLKWRDANGCN